MIEIGDSYYCRKNDGEWVRSKSACGTGGGIGGGPSDVRSSKYTVEEIKIDKKKAKLYTSYITYKNTFSPRSDKENLYYWENKFWLNSDGFVIREELKRGLLSPERLDEQESKTYEYDPNIKIEAPIK